MVWLTLLVWRLLYVWKAVDNFVFIPNKCIRTCQICEVILMSLSNTMSVGSAWVFHFFFRNIFPMFLVETLVGRGIRWAMLVNLLTITQIWCNCLILADLRSNPLTWKTRVDMVALAGLTLNISDSDYACLAHTNHLPKHSFDVLFHPMPMAVILEPLQSIIYSEVPCYLTIVVVM